MKKTAVVLFAWLAGCGFGRVNQGQVIEYRQAEGLVTLISDSNYRDPAHPRFDILPPVTIHVPADRREMGPAPEAGKLLQLDRRNRRAVIFDSRAGSLRTVAFHLTAEQTGVGPGDARLRANRFPVVDRAHKAITIYSPRDRTIMTFSVTEECFALPDDSWKIGDEVRYYYKDPQRALRLMNVTKTDLNEAAK